MEIKSRVPLRTELAIAKAWAGEAYRITTALALQTHNTISLLWITACNSINRGAKITEETLGDAHIR